MCAEEIEILIGIPTLDILPELSNDELDKIIGSIEITRVLIKLMEVKAEESHASRINPNMPRGGFDG